MGFADLRGLRRHHIIRHQVVLNFWFLFWFLNTHRVILAVFSAKYLCEILVCITTDTVSICNASVYIPHPRITGDYNIVGDNAANQFPLYVN